MPGTQQHHQVVLDPVGVLVLIDQHVFEPLPVVLQDVGVLAEEPNGVVQQVVEVHGPGLTEPGLVLGKNLA